MTQARHYIIHGKVQGVGFRQFTRTQALSLGLDGWVKNLPGGEVECLALGQAEMLERFEGKLRQGPPLSRVSQIDQKIYSPEATAEEAKKFNGNFSILY